MRRALKGLPPSSEALAPRAVWMIDATLDKRTHQTEDRPNMFEQTEVETAASCQPAVATCY